MCMQQMAARRVCSGLHIGQCGEGKAVPIMFEFICHMMHFYSVFYLIHNIRDPVCSAL